MTLSEPAVSVLMGVWNNERTLARAVAGILDQSWDDLELILIDDGSEDGSAEVCKASRDADPRVRVLRLPHQGIPTGLNEGLRAARARYIAVNDADDVSLLTRLERQVAVLDARPEVAVVGCRMREVNRAGQTLTTRTHLATGDLGDDLLRFNPIPASAAMFRRDLVVALGGFRLACRYASDYDLWLRLTDEHVATVLDEELTVRELSGSNASSRHETRQAIEALGARVRTVVRRRQFRLAASLVRPAVSLGTPLPLKRRLRARRGQAT